MLPTYFISIISCSFTASRNIELTSFGGKKELCDFSDTGILLAKLGPILVSPQLSPVPRHVHSELLRLEGINQWLRGTPPSTLLFGLGT